MNQVSVSQKTPKTERGRRTRNKLLEAAEIEFGEKGFHEAGISGITYRAGVALGTFYNYFESKEEIFRALVRFMSRRTRKRVSQRVANAPDRLSAERMGIEAYIEFAREHKSIYRIISEAEFVAPKEHRNHYEGFAQAYQANLEKAAQNGEIRTGDYEVWSWSIMGITVFLGMRYAEWDDNQSAAEIAEIVTDMIARGIAPEKKS
ncbi:MAG: TetR/AcrR family transcriptional regulator [Gammaproteobacteria bacterium]|nr:TetR/AcrR family transcriptional regulator [Gammaproteobacteria bacterium]MBT8076006.1 TetR/AcrR family transcriptional regulator [Gammaproteobacteria bacterium]NNL00408.1 TetR/AcrR family transcriptional regulator [Xanthomonadales bacterium]